MQYEFSPSRSRPVTIDASTEAQVYGLFAFAMFITALGVYAGNIAAPMLLGAGLHMVLLLVQLGLLFTASFWMDRSPLNYVLFGLFPFISGFTIAPFIGMVMTGYENGPSILLNALSATAFMSLAAALWARTTSIRLGMLGNMLMLSLLGLLGMSILQYFVPALQTPRFELFLSGFGVVLFGLFTAYDMQRIQELGKVGANPFMLALSLYLDIFNLFVSLVRFMIALSGDRR
jgi:FtsH-binding integral membrane protein